MLMRNRISALILFTAVFAFALVLLAAYQPPPIVILPAQSFSSLEAIGNAAYTSRPMPESFVAAIGLPAMSDFYGEIVHQYITQMIAEHPETVVFLPQGLNAQLSGAQVYGVEPQELSRIFKVVAPLIADKKRVLLVMPSSESSHRFAQNFMTQLEKMVKLQVPTLTLAQVALTKQDEANLQPNCRASLRDGEGGVFDLGCLILGISRKFQVQNKSQEESFMYAESEMGSENILAIFQTSKGK